MQAFTVVAPADAVTVLFGHAVHWAAPSAVLYEPTAHTAGMQHTALAMSGVSKGARAGLGWVREQGWGRCESRAGVGASAGPGWVRTQSRGGGGRGWKRPVSLCFLLPISFPMIDVRLQGPPGLPL